MEDSILRHALVLGRLSWEQVPLRQLASDRESIGELVDPYGTSHVQLVHQLFHRNSLKLARCGGNFFRNARIPLGLGMFAPLDQVFQGGQLGVPQSDNRVRGVSRM